jgi:hypothetical protein
MLNAAIGFRAHSGWAAAVAVAGGKAIERRRLEICDCLLRGSAQPYHTVAKMPLPEARRFLERCARISTAMAEQAVRKMTTELAAGGYRVSHCSILLGSGRPLGELEKTLASHPLIRTAEGEFYREALREACRLCGLPIEGIKERDLSARLADAAELGKALGPPWRRDEKLCALAALRAVQSNISAT